MSSSHFPVLSRAVLEAAADWHVRLRFDAAINREATEQAEVAHAQWLAASEQHRRAWGLVERMDRQLGGLPQAPSLNALNASREQQLHRRTVLRGLLVIAGSTGMGWGAYDQLRQGVWFADYRTAAGEHRQIQLADGGRVDLNTATALDVKYDSHQRLLRLHKGEILVQTAPDSAACPFFVDTPQGRIHALGTRFGVRIYGDSTRVSVYEHAVDIRPQAGHHRLRVDAGNSATFTATQITPTNGADTSQLAWTRGMLVAVDQRLDDFLNELSRYQRGRIDCDPAVAELRVTGAYRLGDIDHVLEGIALSHPVIIKRFAGIWTRVMARQ
ncbi:FecR domain-containing protein [Cellvibrio sp. NN19]|uniref:FecR domain-containing protein n=1 Tax=Cellvibrio chitinivorans TaxID=3102792 RepID=UPI002B40C017|nr:FecR domain-containing protein [Cellvibrio sp. NN19]